MGLYLSMDGGGTKLAAILYDDDFNVLARGRSGGVNFTQNKREAVLEHIEDCVRQVLPREGMVIDDARIVIVGPIDLLVAAIRRRATLVSYRSYNEPVAALLAGAAARSGLVALSGTGSDMFRVSEGERCDAVGGWGPVFGDQGSGTWMSLQAVRAVCRELNGWGEQTALTPMIREALGGQEDVWAMVRLVHGSSAPYSVISPLTPLVGKAARAGDAVALSIVREAGRLLALQMLALLRRFDAPEESVITLCGGAWKVHEDMLSTFLGEIHKEHPKMRAQRPWFEHVAAGAVDRALNKGMTSEEVRAFLSRKLDKEIIVSEGVFA